MAQSDSPREAWPPKVKGDVDRVERLSGEPGAAGAIGSLIAVWLVGHPHRYVVRVDMSAATPRLVELRIDSPDDAPEIDPAVMRVPVRRLTRAAAGWIARADGAFVTPDQVDDTALLARPEVVERRRPRHLDDDHYKRIAAALLTARRAGARSPRKVVAADIGVPVLTVDRWIATAKDRGYLARDWATSTHLTSTEPETRA